MPTIFVGRDQEFLRKWSVANSRACLYPEAVGAPFIESGDLRRRLVRIHLNLFDILAAWFLLIDLLVADFVVGDRHAVRRPIEDGWRLPHQLDGMRVDRSTDDILRRIANN